MPEKVTAYKVFVASPGGLDAERRAFRSTLAEHNDSDALYRGCIFLPVGWEATLGGVGRPQERINEDVKKCDYFVLVLQDRWGSPTGTARGSKYSSGTEEEFHVAMECLDDESMPMAEVVVLFGSVDEGKLRDPGPQLAKVLEFRNKLEVEKTLLFSQFDELSRFEALLRRQLAHWVREHERGDAGAGESAKTPPSSLQEPPTLSLQPPGVPVFEPGVETVLERALNLESEGQVTEAEATFAEALAGRESAAILLAYGLLLKRAGRFSDSDRVLRRGLTATGDHDVPLRVLFLNALGIVATLRGQIREAIEVAREALELDPEDWILTRNLGTILRNGGDFEAARSSLEDLVLRNTERFGEGSSEDTSARFALGLLAFEEGRFDEASVLIGTAVEAVRAEPPLPGWNRAEVLYLTGQLYLAMDELGRAEELYNEAAKALGESPVDDFTSDIGIKVGLAEVALRSGESNAAEAQFLVALEAAELVLGPEHLWVARCLRGLGSVYAAQERYEAAETSLVKAWSLWAAVSPEHPGAMRALVELGRLYAQQGQNAAAIRFYEQALRVLRRSVPDHPETAKAQSELDELDKRVAQSPSLLNDKKPESDSTT